MSRSILVLSLLLACLMASTPVAAASFILCTAAEKEDIVLELDSMEFEGQTLSCISGGDFIYDMTPCAPDGGYGLSYPTGSAGLLAVVHRWQDYGDHSGGVVAFTSSASSYSFQGGFTYPGSGYTDAWSFDVSRLTGVAELSIVQEDEEDGAVGRSSELYSCEAVEQKF